MGAKRKGGTRVAEDPEALGRRSLQAILLADSFTTKFRPITLERPKVLLPLVNVPVIDYTLDWLKSEGVKEVFVFCCAHSHQVIDYLKDSEWNSPPKFTVTIIESHNCISAGDALRLIYERDVIHGDFVLVSGDTVSNMSLTHAILEHKERRKKDKNVVMTMVIKQSKPSPIIHQSRLETTDELFMAVDPQTKQLLYYEDRADHLKKGVITLDNTLLADNPRISLHNDLEDCYIDICSPEVLSLFSDNFDYQHQRRLVKELLDDDIMGYKIFTYEIQSSNYAARIDNYRSYDIISKDIIHRSTYPFVPDVFGDPTTKVEREGIYRASEIEQSCSAQIEPFTVLGKGTRIGNKSTISDSVIGKDCAIGSNVSIIGSYIWDDVTIEDGCEIRNAIICDGVIIKSGAVLQPGVVLSFKVVIEPRFVVPAYSKASLLQQPTNQNCDEELEYADNNGGELIPDSNSDDDDDDDDDSRDDTFEKEVELTFLRAVEENIKVGDIIFEMNSLRLSFNMTSAHCGGAIFYAMMKLAMKNADTDIVELLKNVEDIVKEWGELLKRYGKQIDDQIEVILKFEEMCLESCKEFAQIFPEILRLYYDEDIIEEDAILTWADEKKDAEESDKVFVKKSQPLIQWLKEASEEED